MADKTTHEVLDYIVTVYLIFFGPQLIKDQWGLGLRGCSHVEPNELTHSGR